MYIKAERMQCIAYRSHTDIDTRDTCNMTNGPYSHGKLHVNVKTLSRGGGGRGGVPPARGTDGPLSHVVAQIAPPPH